MSSSRSATADSARLAPVVRRANCLVVSEEAKRLRARFPVEAEALGRLWEQDPGSALGMLTAAAWDTALTAGFLLRPEVVEQAIACLLARDLAGYEAVLFRSVPPPSGPGVYVDDGAEGHPALVGDQILDNYLRKLASVRAGLASAKGDVAIELCATYAHRLLKLRQRRRDLLEPAIMARGKAGG
jgi:hypothetical protein